MGRWARSRTVIAVVVGGAVLAGLFVSPAAARLQAIGSTIETLSSEKGLGATHGRALYLSVEGVGDLTIGDGAGYAAYTREQKDIQVPVIPAELLAPCGSGTVGIEGSDRCLDRAKLAERGVDVSPDGTVLEESLFQAEITSRDVQESSSAFPQPLEAGTTIGSGALTPASDFLGSRLSVLTPDAQTPAANPQGYARAVGVVIPNLAKAEAVCDGRTGTANASASSTGLTLPAPLAPVITGAIGLAGCDLAREVGGSTAYPSLRQSFGEAALEVTATQTLVDSVPAVNTVLDTLIDSTSAVQPVNDLLSTLRQQLEAAPLASIQVAPGEELITSSDQGMQARSETGDVLIDVLGGVAQIRVSSAVSTASVLDRAPASSAECAFVDVRVLNFLTADPADYIEQTIPCPSADQELLGGLPAPVGDALRIAISTGQTTATQGRFSATSSASVLNISLFSSPLPEIRLQLASGGAFAQVTPGSVQRAASFPVSLPKTGPMAGVSATLGLGLLGLAGYLRRRLNG